MNRINQTMARLRQEGRKALVTYQVAGDLSREITLAAMHAMVKAGADILELGAPFSDPTAEGPTIQRAHERALANKVSLRDVLSYVAEFRQRDSDTPVMLMGYANPIERMGYDDFVAAALAAGVDGVLTVDLPPEEAEEFNAALRKENLESIFLVAPTTTIEREKMIVELAGGFLYYVSLKGVTGAGHLDIESVREKMTELRSLTDLPVCVGFGIKDGASARAVANLSDGAVVGSVLVARMAELAAQGEKDANVIADSAAKLIADIRLAMDAETSDSN